MPGTLTLTAEHVSPALVVPTPVVKTDRGLSLAAKRRNWLLPHPGSPVRISYVTTIRKHRIRGLNSLSFLFFSGGGGVGNSSHTRCAYDMQHMLMPYETHP